MAVVLLLLMGLSTHAQNDTIPEKKANRFAVALNASSLGGGIELARSINERLSLRLRFNTIDLSSIIENKKISIGGDRYSFDGGGKVTELDLSVEYNPFSKSSFKLIGGIGYFTNASFKLKGNHVGGSSYGEIEITPEDIGEINFKVDYKGLAPYVGFGFGRAIPKKRVGLGIEVGTFYFVEQKVSVTGTNLMASVKEQTETFKRDISDYRWYPFVNLRLAVRL